MSNFRRSSPAWKKKGQRIRHTHALLWLFSTLLLRCNFFKSIRNFGITLLRTVLHFVRSVMIVYILHTFHSVPAYYTHSTTTVQERFILVLKRLYAIDTYKRHGCTWALLQWWALSNKLCILSVVRVEHPLVICEVSSGSPQGAESVRSRVRCRSSRLWKWLAGYVFFSMPVKRDTRLATEVQQSSFIPIKTAL